MQNRPCVTSYDLVHTQYYNWTHTCDFPRACYDVILKSQLILNYMDSFKFAEVSLSKVAS